MTAILILDNQAHRREHLSQELEKEGYCLTAISDAEWDQAHFDCSQFDMAILNLYPDSIKTWALYYDFRKYFPGFPVLVYLIKNIYALKSLKVAIKDILFNQSSHQLMQKNSQEVRSIFL